MTQHLHASAMNLSLLPRLLYYRQERGTPEMPPDKRQKGTFSSADMPLLGRLVASVPSGRESMRTRCRRRACWAAVSGSRPRLLPAVLPNGGTDMSW